MASSRLFFFFIALAVSWVQLDWNVQLHVGTKLFKYKNYLQLLPRHVLTNKYLKTQVRATWQAIRLMVPRYLLLVPNLLLFGLRRS